MKLSSNQELPNHLRKRRNNIDTPIYDLTFDYDSDVFRVILAIPKCGLTLAMKRAIGISG